MGTDRNYLDFKKARKVVRALELKSSREYREMSKAKKLPKGLPSYAQNYYAGNGWEGWQDFLGYKEQLPKNPGNFYSYSDAKRIVKPLGLGPVENIRSTLNQKILMKSCPKILKVLINGKGNGKDGGTF